MNFVTLADFYKNPEIYTDYLPITLIYKRRPICIVQPLNPLEDEGPVIDNNLKFHHDPLPDPAPITDSYPRIPIRHFNRNPNPYKPPFILTKFRKDHLEVYPPGWGAARELKEKRYWESVMLPVLFPEPKEIQLKKHKDGLWSVRIGEGS